MICSGTFPVSGFLFNFNGRAENEKEELSRDEKEIVNEEMLRHPLNINLKYGGDGGWPTNSLEHQSNAGRLGGLTSKGNARFFTREQRANNGKNSIHQNRMFGMHLTGAIFTNLTHDHLDYHKIFEHQQNRISLIAALSS